MRAGAGRLGGGGGGGILGGGGGGGPHGTNDDFWLPKVKYFESNNVKLSAQVSGATGQGRKGAPQQFHSVVRFRI